MALMIASVAVGTALAASLITISFEISGKVSKELRAFGANILVEPAVEGLADITDQKRYLNEFNNKIFVKLIIKERWYKKLDREQRFLGSSNNVVFSSNIGFDFLALGNLNNKVIRGTNPNEYDAMSQEDLSRVKVQTSKKALIWEINDDSTVEKVRKITKTGSIFHASQLSEQLSKHPLASKL